MIKTDTKNDGICIVRPGSERLTAANATSFKTDVFELIDKGESRFVIDLGNVTFVDSSGLGAMVGLLKKIGNRGEIVVCGLADSVAQMFAITRMNRVFVAYENSDAAVSALQERV